MTATLTDTLVVEHVVEHRQAQVADVNFPKRLITVVAMPYERPAQVPYRGRTITEVVSRGAFAGIEQRTDRVKVNRDHSWEKPIGRVVGFHPSRTEGLVTELKISNTRLGEESLELAADEVLGASAGFALLGDKQTGRPYPDAERWENRSVRRLDRLFLDHVALVPNPAYSDAVTLDVRNTPATPQEPFSDDEMPNRDRIALQELKAAHDALNAKYVS